MSESKKTVVEQLEAASGQLTELQAAFDAHKAKADADAVKAASDLAALTKERDEVKASLEAKDAELAALKGEADKANAQAQELTAKVADLSAKLADPALLAAAAHGEKPVPQGAAAEGADTVESLRAKLEKETEPLARAKCRAALVELIKSKKG